MTVWCWFQAGNLRINQGIQSIAAAEDRLEMCRLAVAGDDFFAVDDLELNRPGPSYTIDTVRVLRTRGWSEISWLIGADMVQCSARLAQSCRVAGRGAVRSDGPTGMVI